MRLTADFASIGPGGIVTGGATIAIVAVAIAMAPVSGLELILLWGLAVIFVMALAFVWMPLPLRIMLIAMLLGTTFGVTASGDPTGTKTTSARIDRTIADSAAEREANEEAAEGPETALGGARIVLTGDPWAEHIAAKLDATIGGAAAAILSITGEVSTKQVDDGVQIAIVWGILRDGSGLECGTTTVTGRDDAMLVAAARAAFVPAIAASLAHDGARCA